MRKNIFGRQFKRDTNERKALFKGLMSSLVLQESIKTTEEKAKAIRPSAEKLITLVKRHGQNSNQFLAKYLTPLAIKKLVRDVVPRFKTRNGGYTRIIHLGNRFSDNASTALIEWVEREKLDIGNQKSENKKQSVSIQSKSRSNKKKTPIRKRTPITKESNSKSLEKPKKDKKNKEI